MIQKTTISLTVNVNTEESKGTPIINANNQIIMIGGSFDPFYNVTAFDADNKDITKQIKILQNDVDTAKAGVYTVIYQVSDDNGNTSTKTIIITVKESNSSHIDYPNSNTPNTGDSGNIYLWLTLLLISVDVLFVLSHNQKRPYR